eukprot:scaffold63162_cov48-Phaeocystis_antarctica.AAC.3
MKREKCDEAAPSMYTPPPPPLAADGGATSNRYSPPPPEPYRALTCDPVSCSPSYRHTSSPRRKSVAANAPLPLPGAGLTSTSGAAAARRQSEEDNRRSAFMREIGVVLFALLTTCAVLARDRS